MTYFNTVNETGVDLFNYVKETRHQDELVLKCFQDDCMHSPSDVHEYLIAAHYITPSVPLTSIRRSITTLTRKGLLYKTGGRNRGPYGRAEYYWRKVQA
jgi:hypothetical protein